MSHGTPSTALDLNAILANAAVTYDADRARHRADADRLAAERDAALATLAAQPTRPAGPDDFPAATSLCRQRAEDHAQRVAYDYNRRIADAARAADLAAARAREARAGRLYVSRDDYRGSDWMMANHELYRAALDAGRVVF